MFCSSPTNSKSEPSRYRTCHRPLSYIQALRKECFLSISIPSTVKKSNPVAEPQGSPLYCRQCTATNLSCDELLCIWHKEANHLRYIDNNAAWFSYGLWNWHPGRCFFWPIHCRWKLKFLFPVATYYCLNPNSELCGCWAQTCNFTLSQPTVLLFSHIQRQQRIIWAYGDSFEYMRTHNWLILPQPTCNQPSWFPHLFRWWNVDIVASPHNSCVCV